MIVRATALKIPLPDKSVHCVICSPPYWGLRDYGVPGQLGLEKTPEEYVQKMVQVFREVKRVLRDDGTCWINIGDSYASGTGTCYNPGGGSSSLGKERKEAGVHPLDRGNKSTLDISGLKPKDLCGIPWRLAFALQADGWWLRSDIIWAKPNPMPESVMDRPTKAHEYIFLLTKSPKYFFDQEAVREKQVDISNCRNKPVRANPGIGNTSSGGRREGFEKYGRYAEVPGGRNIRTVWNIATQPFSEAHFATFPEELVRRCLFAGTSEKGCCPKCGGPWMRIIEKRLMAHDGESASQYAKGTTANRLALLRQAARERGEEYSNQTKTLGWRPSCECGEERTVPAIVFDPFFGSGTVGVVAQKYNRRFIGLELKPEYCQMAQKRVNSQSMPMI